MEKKLRYVGKSYKIMEKDIESLQSKAQLESTNHFRCPMCRAQQACLNEIIQPQYRTLHNTVLYEDVDAVEAFLEDGIGPINFDQFGFTPMYTAAMAGQVVIIDVLHRAGADPNMVYIYGALPIRTAVANNCGAAIEALNRLGADVNYVNEDGQ